MRPKKKRSIKYKPEVVYFKPRGVPLLSLDEVELNHDELEALRLKYVREMEQLECSKEMNISQSTFQRILASANKKVAKALVKGKAIKINL